MLVNITCGHNEQGLTMDDLKHIKEKISEYTGRAKNFKHGLIWDDDPEFGDTVRITSIVTGLHFSDVVGPTRDVGNYIIINRNFKYNKSEFAAEDGITIYNENTPHQIGFNSKSNVRTFNFDLDKRPALAVVGGENLSELENIPAIRRTQK